MTKYKYKVVYSSKFKKSIKKIIKQGKDIDKLRPIIEKLTAKESLETKFKNHKLNDNKIYKNCYECHIEPDWLLVYQFIDDKLVLLLVNTGSHAEVLDM